MHPDAGWQFAQEGFSEELLLLPAEHVIAQPGIPLPFCVQQDFAILCQIQLTVWQRNALSRLYAHRWIVLHLCLIPSAPHAGDLFVASWIGGSVMRVDGSSAARSISTGCAASAMEPLKYSQVPANVKAQLLAGLD